MLNWTTVLKYIKGRLALPSSFIEKADEEIKEWVMMTALPEFSEHIPDVEWTSVVASDPSYKAEKENEFYFWDDEDLPIYGIRNCYFGVQGLAMTGHPYAPPMSFQGMKEFALQAFKSNMLRPYSYWGYTCTFIRPNKVRVLPSTNETFVVEYERMQPKDLRKIPFNFSRSFMDLALAEVMIWIGTMRSHYGDGRVMTPWGDIPLNGDTLKADGENIKVQVIDKISTASMPGVIIDIH